MKLSPLFKVLTSFKALITLQSVSIFSFFMSTLSSYPRLGLTSMVVRLLTGYLSVANLVLMFWVRERRKE